MWRPSTLTSTPRSRAMCDACARQAPKTPDVVSEANLRVMTRKVASACSRALRLCSTASRHAFHALESDAFIIRCTMARAACVEGGGRGGGRGARAFTEGMVCGARRKAEVPEVGRGE